MASEGPLHVTVTFHRRLAIFLLHLSVPYIFFTGRYPDSYIGWVARVCTSVK